MKTLLYALLLASPLLADSDAGLPPNIYEQQGGKIAPTFTDANSEAVSWLNLIDQGQYASSWGDAGPLFKDVITSDQWVAAMKGTRQPLGQQLTRKVGNHQAASTLGNGTRGNFMTISYQTSFSGKPHMTETIILMTIEHNQWRVIGYSIK